MVQIVSEIALVRFFWAITRTMQNSFTPAASGRADAMAIPRLCKPRCV
jgi:hypothetical protein